MPHDHNTQNRKEKSQNALVTLEEKISKSINDLKEEFIDLKGIIIKKLKEDNEILRRKFNTLEKWFGAIQYT